MDAATVGSNSFSHPLSDFLQEHVGSSTSILDTKDGKVDTVKKIQKVWVYRFTIDPPLLILLWQASIIPFSTQAWAEEFKLYRPPATARVEWGSFTCFSLCFWGRNLSRLLAEVGSISPRHLQWRCAKNMQSWDFNCLFRRLKSSSSRQLPKGFRFLCSQRGRESCSSLCLNEVLSCCIIMFYLIRMYLGVVFYR